MTSEPMVVGVDVGAARTKLARSDGLVWSGPAGDPFPFPLAGATAVVAVADRWRLAGRTRVGDLAATPGGAERLRELAALGVAHTRLLPALQCLAATEVAADPEPGCLLVCDVGATTVDAAVYCWDGAALRLLAAEHADAGAAQPDALLLDRLVAQPLTVDPAVLLRSIADERCARGGRAALVLDRAARQERYWETPVLFAGRHGGPVLAKALHAALEPIAETARRTVARLVRQVPDALRPDLVATGGNALGCVVAAVRAAAGRAVERVRVVDPTQTARGAALIGQGAVTAAEGFPHEIGLLAHQVRAGLLEPVVLPVRASTALTVEVPDDHAGPFPLVVRIGGAGPWRRATASEHAEPAPGEYALSADHGRAGLGAVLARRAGPGTESGRDVEVLLAAAPGPVVEGVS
ncbi:hypothetical protein ACOBQX_22805 [Actinokineospora sp. G85]|uniref:hypothetical protein n=1 Tax=Actinokineospora sp. G85 TaxID=3406626 RepID=UPI003C718248